MNTIRQTWSYILGVSLLLVSQFVFADSSNLSDIAFGSDQVKNYTDLSISYLSQILGTVGNVLHGTNGQVLGQMFYVFNTGILIVAGIWLCYTVLTILLKSSQEGSFSGQNRNAAVIFLKIALGIAFLVPSPSTGYNVLQAIVAKVVVYGIDLADSVWNKTLSYMSDGGTIFSLNSLTDSNSASGLNENVLTKESANKAINAVTTVLANTTCYYQASSTRTSPINMIVDNDKYQLQFPGPNDDASATSLSNPGCGYVSWDIDNYCTIANDKSNKYTDDEKTEAAKKCSYYQQGLYQVVTDLWQTGLDYANFYPVSDDSSTWITSLTASELKSEAKTSIVNAFIDYVNLVLPVTRMDAVTEEQKNFYEDQVQNGGGWITAGEFYWKLISYNEEVSKSAGQISVPVSDTSDGSSTVNGPDNSVLNGNYKVANTAINKLPSNKDSDGNTMLDSLISELKLTGSDFTSAMGKKTIGLRDKLAAIGGAGIVKAVDLVKTAISINLLAPVDNIDALMNALTNTNRNPLIWARDVGKAMLTLASTYLIVLSILFSVLGTVGSIIIQGQPFGVGVSVALSSIANAIMSILKMMVVPLVFICVLGGVVLAYYVPLYPFFVFTFGIAVFFLNVIEGFLAAPLVALGLTHPEGHDFLGKAEQALILLLNLFVRPTLMVFGMIVGILTSYVLFELIQHGIMVVFQAIGIMGRGSHVDFGSTLSASMFLKSVLGQYGFLSNLILLIVLSMYVLLVYQVTIKAFSGIYAFPNRIWRWIGGFEQQDDSAMMAEQQKGIGTQGGGQGAKMATDQVNQSAKGATDGFGDALKNKKAKAENEKNG